MKSALFFLFLATAALASPPGPHAEHARHGFVLLGARQLHLYHLSRFESPHRWEAIFEVEIPGVDVAAIRRELPPDTVLSLVTGAPFALDELAARPFSFPADLVKGYLRDAAHTEVIARGVTVRRLAVRRFRELLPGAPASERYRLAVVCDEGERTLFGAHLVAGRPSFEELIRLRPFADVRCEPGQQGRVVEVPGAPDRPLAAEGVVEARLVLDSRAVNGGTLARNHGGTRDRHQRR